MRRAGINPTEVEVHDIINRHDDGSGVFNFDEFCKVVRKYFTLSQNNRILDHDEEIQRSGSGNILQRSVQSFL